MNGKQIRFELPNELYTALRRRSDETGIPMSKLIRKSIIQHLSTVQAYHTSNTHPQVGLTPESLRHAPTLERVSLSPTSPTPSPSWGSTKSRTPVRDLSTGRDFRPLTKERSIKEGGADYSTDVDYVVEEPVE